MLAAVAIVSGTLYGTGYINFCSNSATGMDMQQLQLDNFGVSTEDGLQLALQNRDPQNFEHQVKEIELTDRNSGQTITYSPNEGDGAEISPGVTETLTVPEIDSTTDCNDFEVEIEYDRGDVLPNQKTAGTMTKNMEITEEVNQPYEPTEITLSSEDNSEETTSEGDTLEVDYTLENEMEEEQTETVYFSVENSNEEIVHEDDEEQTIDSEDTVEDTFTYELDEDGEHQYTISTEEGGEEQEQEFGEEEEEIVQVSIQNTNSPVQEGNTLEAEFEATNNKDEEETQQFELLLEEEQVDTEELTITSESSQTEQLEFENTEQEGEGEYEITVEGEEDSDTTTIEITEDEEEEEETEATEFLITEMNAPEEAEQEEQITVDTEIENQGETGEQDINLNLNSDTLETEENFQIEEEQTETITFEDVQIPENQETGEQDLEIATEDDTETQTIQITEQEEEEEETEDPELQSFEVQDESSCEGGGQGNPCNQEDTAEFVFDWSVDDPNDELEVVEIEVDDALEYSEPEEEDSHTFFENDAYEEAYDLEFRAEFEDSGDICLEGEIIADEENYDEDDFEEC